MRFAIHKIVETSLGEKLYSSYTGVIICFAFKRAFHKNIPPIRREVSWR